MSTMWLSFVNDEGFAGVVLVDQQGMKPHMTASL